MLRMPASAFEDDARGLINTRMALRLLWVGVAVCGIGGIASWLQPFQITTAARAVLVGVQVLLALLCVAGTQLVHALPARVLVLGALWASVVAATLAALSVGHGAHSLDLSFFPLIVCTVAVLAGTRQALAMAMACVLIVGGLAWVELDGWLPATAALAHSPLSHPLVTHGLLLLAGFTIGAILLRLSNASYRSAQEGEARLRGLLATAADHFWELDASLRLRRADDAATLATSALFKPHLMRPLIEVIDVLRARRRRAGPRPRRPACASRVLGPARQPVPRRARQGDARILRPPALSPTAAASPATGAWRATSPSRCAPRPSCGARSRCCRRCSPPRPIAWR